MTNRNIVTAFFTALGNNDYKAMNALYSEDVLFSDPLYGFLRGDEVRNKWELFCTTSTNCLLQIHEIKEEDESYITCKWSANYFSLAFNKPISQSIQSFMKIEDGKITEHSDGYKPSQWINQIYGLPAKLFSWSSFMRKKAGKALLKNLALFSHNKKHSL